MSRLVLQKPVLLDNLRCIIGIILAEIIGKLWL